MLDMEEALSYIHCLKQQESLKVLLLQTASPPSPPAQQKQWCNAKVALK